MSLVSGGAAWIGLGWLLPPPPARRFDVELVPGPPSRCPSSSVLGRLLDVVTGGAAALAPLEGSRAASLGLPEHVAEVVFATETTVALVEVAALGIAGSVGFALVADAAGNEGVSRCLSSPAVLDMSPAWRAVKPIPGVDAGAGGTLTLSRAAAVGRASGIGSAGAGLFERATPVGIVDCGTLT